MFGENIMSCACVLEWYKPFSVDLKKVEDDERRGRTLAAKN